MTGLLRYDDACRAVAEAKSFDEVRDWEDKAAAVREYARRAKNRSMEIDALEIRERARRRRGELLIELKADGKLVEGRKKLSTADDSLRVTLEQLDTTADESSRDQKLAQMEGNSFERLIARCRAYMQDNPEKHSFSSIPQDGPINGARSIMGSRQEPDDSLDYFPTPPWATRALVELVLPQVGVTELRSVWEPACGEGHIADVLREYCPIVHASDVFDYGYGDVFDYLGEGKSCRLPAALGVHWVITNPPFDSKALEFALKALALDAGQGVALFVRWQWIETVGRYEKLFKPWPPVLVCPFAERVPLHKGRWEPDGDTATAYCWVVWMRDAPSRETRLFWIPPGCREQLSRPDDVERFTEHPVIKRLPPHDPVTGEWTEPKGSEAA